LRATADRVDGGDRSAHPREAAADAPDGSTHWSTRKLGPSLKINHNLVAKAWQRAGLQPHRFVRYVPSDDPASMDTQR